MSVQLIVYPQSFEGQYNEISSSPTEFLVNGINFANGADIYDMPKKAVDVIDQVIEKTWIKKNWKDRVE